MIETFIMKALNRPVFINLRNRKSITNFLSRLWLHQINIDILKRLYCKTYKRGVFRTQLSICNKDFLVFLQGRSTICVWLCSKYASEYIYRRSVLQKVYVWFIPSETSRVKPNAKYLTHSLSSGAIKGFWRNRNSRYEIIRKIVSL